MGKTWEPWLAEVLGEYMRLTGEERGMAEMAIDHWHDILRDLYREEAQPIEAAKAMVFDDETT